MQGFAEKTKVIPAPTPRAPIVWSGALLSYGPSLAELAPRAAEYVDRILKGAKPGDLPLEGPTRYYLTVNLKTAKALGIEVPTSILLRADEVIE